MNSFSILRTVTSLNIRKFSVGVPKNDFVKNTVDQNEIDLHSSIGDWWDENGTMKALHAMNSVRIPFIRTGLLNTGRLKEDEVESSPNYLKGVKLLDVGCGGGILSIPLARLGADVTGIDPSTKLIDVARREAGARLTSDSKIQFLPTPIEDHEEKHIGVYDAVILSEVIEHVTQKEEFINMCVNTLKPAGSIFFTTINRTMASWLGAIITAEYVLEFVPRGTHNWEKFVTPEELKKYLERAGCKTIQCSGLIYQPFTNEWMWSATPAVLYALHAVKHP